MTISRHFDLNRDIVSSKLASDRTRKEETDMADSPPKTPRWVKVFGIIVLALIVVVVALLLFGPDTFGPGEHGPARHIPSSPTQQP